MHFQMVDWLAVLLAIGVIMWAGYLCKRYVKDVSGFLVAGRGVGRFLGVGADSMQGLGAVTILAFWQMNYRAGFSGQWWFMLTPVAGILVALTGWGIYRFRQTRAMTLGQLIEMRYGKRTRIFFGILAYAAGVLNMGIFPIIGANFFVHYIGLPPTIDLGIVVIPTVLAIMLFMVTMAVILCFWGGQVTLVITDFMQSMFINFMLIFIMIVIYRMFSWDQFAEAYRNAPNGPALINPFHSEGASEFTKWFFLINVWWLFYNVISWSPQTMMAGSARHAHEAKIMRTLLQFRQLAMAGLGMTVLPLAAFVMMNHVDFADKAAQVTETLSHIENAQVRNQMLTPTAITHIIPAGLLGAFAGVLAFALISTWDSYLLAWGGLLVQDVIMPIRNKPLTPKAHMLLIRLSVLFVGIFIVIFSMTFNQVDNIFMFFDISASLYIGSAGVVLLGALYWRRGTTTAAWVTMLLGATLSISGFIYRSINPDFLDGRIMAFWVTIICVATYILVSLIGKDPKFDLDEMLNRPAKETNKASLSSIKNWWPFQWGPEVPDRDKVFIKCILIGIGVFIVIFTGVAIYNNVVDVPVDSWLNFWHKYLYVMFLLGSAFLIFIGIGGIRDLLKLLKALKTKKIDTEDDGSVHGHHAAGNLPKTEANTVESSAKCAERNT